MNATLPRFRPEALPGEPKFPFSLAVAYEDDIMRSRAMGLYEEIESSLRAESEVQFSWWKFHFLYDPALLDRAVTAAIQADMIVVALRDPKELSWVARKWIEKWLERKDGRDCALVVLVDGGPSARPEDCPVLGYLESVAHLAQMNFFPHVFHTTPSNFINPLAGIPARETIVKSLVEDVLRSPTNVTFWGINDY